MTDKKFWMNNFKKTKIYTEKQRALIALKLDQLVQDSKTAPLLNPIPLAKSPFDYTGGAIAGYYRNDKLYLDNGALLEKYHVRKQFGRVVKNESFLTYVVKEKRHITEMTDYLGLVQKYKLTIDALDKLQYAIKS
jgi:hypothetical protein